MKIKSILALVLALLLLAGCTSGLEEDRNNEDRGDAVSDPAQETTQEQEVLVTVECLTSVISRSGDEERTATIGYEQDGIHVIPQELVDQYLTVCSPEGLELYELRYNEEGVNDRRSEYSYNEDGLRTEYRYYNLEDGVLSNWTVYTYDEDGHLLKTQGFYGKNYANGYWEYSYDDQGNRILSSYTDGEGKNTWRYTYTYDENGRILTESIYVPYDSKEGHDRLGYYTYSYDASGRLSKKIWTETQGSIFVHDDIHYTYNEAGLLTCSTQIDEHGKVDEVMTYTYDSQNRLISMVDEKYDYSVTYVYGQMELPQERAEDALVWSETGLIAYCVPQPE